MNKTSLERLYNGLVKENPTFVLMLGMCPTLAVTTSAINGMGMGLTTAVVLALSNVIISLMRKIIPSKVRIPAFIVIIASFVTVVQLLLEAYLPFLNEALGVYIPLIVVNCIILGRAEAYAYSNPPIPSLFDGIGMGLGFTVALTMIGAVREVLGAAKIFGIEIPGMVPIGIFVLAPGAFFVLATLTAIQNFIKIQGEKRGKDMSKIQSGCNEDCMNCGDKGCSKRFYDTEAEVVEEVVVENNVEETLTENIEVNEPKTKEKKAKKGKSKVSKEKEPKVEKELDFIDLDQEAQEETAVKVETEIKVETEVKVETEDVPEVVAEEVKPKRKPRKKTVKAETAESAEETKGEAEAQAETEVKVETEDVPEVVAEEVKPKRKPRKKTVKAETAESAEETKGEAEAQAETEVKAETEAAPEAAAEEVKPKRKPRKKAVKTVTAETQEEKADTVVDQEKEDKS